MGSVSRQPARTSGEPPMEDLIANCYEFIRDHPIRDGETFRVTHLQRTARSTSAICSIEVGGGLRPHLHRHHDEIIVFLEGKADFRLGDQLRQGRAGDVVVVPAGTVHATMNAATRVVIAAVFAPNFDPHDEDRVYVD